MSPPRGRKPPAAYGAARLAKKDRGFPVVLDRTRPGEWPSAAREPRAAAGSRQTKAPAFGGKTPPASSGGPPGVPAPPSDGNGARRFPAGLARLSGAGASFAGERGRRATARGTDSPRALPRRAIPRTPAPRAGRRSIRATSTPRRTRRSGALPVQTAPARTDARQRRPERSGGARRPRETPFRRGRGGFGRFRVCRPPPV